MVDPSELYVKDLIVSECFLFEMSAFGSNSLKNVS